jgi:hypothetical protein
LMTAFGSLQTVVEHFLSQQKIVVAFSVWIWKYSLIEM